MPGRSSAGRIFCAVAGCALLCLLYFSNLSAMGLVSTDEPRYADIGRAMAQTGDWITPRLSGHPWFEKPALLYWMIAAGFKFGLGPETAPRLPVAAMGLAFLAFYWVRLRALWDATVATYSTAILGTSAGWLAYSHAALTDVPVAALFSAAVLMSMEREAGQPRRTVVAALLGLAVLAKSLFPLVLFLPVLALDYREWRAWLKPGPVAAFTVIALPWHILCTAANGSEFLRVLFVEHQFGRFTSDAVKHAQPFWYYVPVAVLLLYPWFPLLGFPVLAMAGKDRSDRRKKVLFAVALFGFVFISASVNKLPGYLLPLLPVVCALTGAGMAESRKIGWLVAAPVALLGILPAAAEVLPKALDVGLRASAIPWGRFPLWLAVGLAMGGAVVLVPAKMRVLAAATLAAICFIWFETAVFPLIDKAASARSLWRERHMNCLHDTRRSVVYGLNYYAGRELPQCDILNQSAGPALR